MKNTDKKSAKKHLELTITEKFMAALAELGHDADKLKREIRKASKFVAKKIERRFKDVKHVIEDKLDSAPVKEAVKKAGKSATTVKKDIAKKAVKVEKVITKAARVAEKRIRKPATKATEKIDSAIADTKAAVAAPAKKAAVKVVAAAPKAAAAAKPVASAKTKAAPAAKTADKEVKK